MRADRIASQIRSNNSEPTLTYLLSGCIASGELNETRESIFALAHLDALLTESVVIAKLHMA